MIERDTFVKSDKNGFRMINIKNAGNQDQSYSLL